MATFVLGIVCQPAMTYLLIIVGILILAAIVFFLVPTFSKDNRFVTEAGSQDLTNFKKLLKAGADPNTVGFMGLTPLICAVQNKRKDNVLFLLDNGADPKGTAGKQSPLTCAIDENDLDIAEILLKAGA